MKEIIGIDGVSAGSHSYHRDCFKCFQCRSVLVVKYYMHEDQPYCEQCYKEATCPTCVLCGDIVDGDGVKIGSDQHGDAKIYHTQCVRYVTSFYLELSS